MNLDDRSDPTKVGQKLLFSLLQNASDTVKKHDLEELKKILGSNYGDFLNIT